MTLFLKTFFVRCEFEIQLWGKHWQMLHQRERACQQPSSYYPILPLEIQRMLVSEHYNMWGPTRKIFMRKDKDLPCPHSLHKILIKYNQKAPNLSMFFLPFLPFLQIHKEFIISEDWRIIWSGKCHFKSPSLEFPWLTSRCLFQPTAWERGLEINLLWVVSENICFSQQTLLSKLSNALITSGQAWSP